MNPGIIKSRRLHMKGKLDKWLKIQWLKISSKVQVLIFESSIYILSVNFYGPKLCCISVHIMVSIHTTLDDWKFEQHSKLKFLTEATALSSQL